MFKRANSIRVTNNEKKKNFQSLKQEKKKENQPNFRCTGANQLTCKQKMKLNSEHFLKFYIRADKKEQVS